PACNVARVARHSGGARPHAQSLPRSQGADLRSEPGAAWSRGESEVKRAALIIVATTCLAACLGGGSDPPRTYYVLQDEAPASDAAAAPSGRQSLVVAASAADVFYDAESLVFSRKPGQRAYYQFAAWTDRPARSVVQLAERRLQARGRFASVTSMSAGVRADLVLNIGIVQFYHDAVVNPAVVRVELSAELIDW